MDMEKRYQVFLSSTFKDLMKERSLVMDTLYKHKCLPVGMENFPSLTIDSLPYIYRLIDESDFFLLILNGVYGSSRDADGKSFTHLEWLHALEMGKPIIVLYRLDWKAHTKIDEDPDDAAAFTKFFNEVKARHDGAKPWQPNTLAALVIEAIDQAIIHHPEAVGWVRADAPGDSNNSCPGVSFDKITGRLRREVKIKANILYAPEGSRSADSLPVNLSCTWEEVFLSFAKKILNALVGESVCVENICDMLEAKHDKEIKESLEGKGRLRLVNLEESEIDNIRLEFATNGLVEIKARGTVFTWRLSELGVKYLKWLHEREFSEVK